MMIIWTFSQEKINALAQVIIDSVCINRDGMEDLLCASELHSKGQL